MQQNNNTYHFYTPEDIKRYLNGSMNVQQMHEMEKAALNDPLLADAIDGFRNADAKITNKHLNDIRAGIIGYSDKEAILKPLSVKQNNWWRWATAACSMGLIAGTIWWFTQKDQQKSDNLPVAVITNVDKPDVVLQKTDSANKNKAAEINKDNIKASNKKTEVIPPKPKNEIHNSKPLENAAQVLADAAPTELSNDFPKAEESFQVKKEIPLLEKTNELPQLYVANDSNLRMTLSKVAYQNKNARFLSPKDTNNFNETVIISADKQERQKGKIGDYRTFQAKTAAPKNQLIYPEEGWTDFYQELNTDLRVDKAKTTKTVQIKFTVDENGDPTDFTIVESPDAKMAKKVIEYIKKSKWKNSKSNKNAVVKIQVN